MKRPEGRHFITALLLGCIVIFALNSWVTLHSIKMLQRSQSEVEHTWQVIYEVETIMGSAKDAESGNRGFLLSGDDTYLIPYTTALRDLPAELGRAEQLTADNPPQRDRFVQIRTLLNKRMTILQVGINIRRSGNTDLVADLLLSGPGKVEMDNLRQIADTIETQEHLLLQQRESLVLSSSRNARFAVIFGSLLDLILIILIFRFLFRERDQRIALAIIAEDLAASRSVIEARAEEVRALNTALHALNVELEERVRQRTVELEAANRELEAFSYSVSHDLRAPLRTIDGFSLALEEDYATAIDATGKDYIQRVRVGVQRMGQLIDALLQLSRVTRGEIAREHVDLTQLANEIAADLRFQNPGRNLSFNIQPGLTAQADPRLLRIALENLFNNAVKFTSRLPQTLIDFAWDPAHNAWFVRDNGAGFDMYYAHKLFNAFNRLHGDKDFKGSGIGLATVARVVHRHHGRIWADSTIGHGATFWFTLG